MLSAACTGASSGGRLVRTHNNSQTRHGHFAPFLCAFAPLRETFFSSSAWSGLRNGKELSRKGAKTNEKKHFSFKSAGLTQ
jgi:hypothetical protein